MEFSRSDYFQRCVDPALEVLEKVASSLPLCDLSLQNSIQIMYSDLSFLKMFFWGFAYFDLNEYCCCFPFAVSKLEMLLCGLPCGCDRGEDDDWCFVLNDMSSQFRRLSEDLERRFDGVLLQWEVLVCDLKKTIQKYKGNVKKICLFISSDASDSYQPQFLGCEWESTASFIDIILKNLQAFDMNVTVKQQISFMERTVNVFGKFAHLARDVASKGEKLDECMSHTQTWAYHVSCLACLCWIDEIDEFLAGELLSDLMEKYMPSTPEVIALYLDVLQATAHSGIQSAVIPQLLVSYVDFVLEHLAIDNFEKLYEGLIFLLSLFMDLVNENTEGNTELILPEIYAAITQVPHVICIPEVNLSSFLDRIDRIKVQVGDLYAVAQLLSRYDSPKTNVVGFLNYLLANLKKMFEGKAAFTPGVKHQIRFVYQELAAVKPFLQINLELLDEHKKLKDLWCRTVDVAYHAAYVTKLCPMTSASVWYGMICLPNVIENIQFVKSEIEVCSVCSGKNDNADQVECSNALQAQTATSMSGEILIGFKQDAEEILNGLLRGANELTVISISGMAGQGKTTLAKKIYNDPSIQYHFHRKVWCYVSKECKPEELLFNIARDLDCNIVNLGIQDLIECLWRSLKGNRYMIVLDDIWDADVWHTVGGSFPNDRNGSRILFTSRNHDLAKQAKPNSICHHLQPFSNEESWELMRKLSNCGGFPEAFLKIGKQIADYCKGLPLAVSLIASHLRSIAQEVDLWEQVAENLKLHLANEGCMHVIELSYKYLPNQLKPCFLYFGAFPRGQNIRARKLKHLWISEGFVEKDGMQSAKECLDDLVSQNLVVVTKRSSTGWIKECRVHHDLLYDLCLEKCVQDNFLQFAVKSIAYDTQGYGFHQRLCIYEGGPFTLPKHTSVRKELAASQIIHTIFLHDYYSLESKSWSYFLRNFRVLTTLDLGYLSLPDFPCVILSNIHLRYLALSGNFKDIPRSIADLWSLETLIVRNGWDVQIPDTLWEMESLGYVHIGRFTLNLNGLWQKNMAAASNTEVLKGITLKYDLGACMFIRRLVKLRKLNCYWNHEERVIHPLWFSMFGSLQKLESLHLSYPLGSNSPVHQQLQPSVNFPENLKKLAISGIGLPWSAMSTIGNLLNLEVLKLRYNACVGTTWHLGNAEFLKLRFLKLQVIEVERIDDSGCDDPFPCLEKLLLRDCEGLEAIPSSFGDICTLDTIRVSCSPKVVDSVRQILEQQRDMGNNHLQVHINDRLMKDNDDHDKDKESEEEKSAG